jgi:hypothetical protein
MVKSIQDQSLKLTHATLRDLRNVISSPASVDGPTPCASPAGPTTDLSGQAPVPANHLASLAKAGEQPTSGTCGLSSIASSASVALQSFLANRLHRALDVNGSPECVLTWKEWDMGPQPPICALRASARRTSGSGSTGSRKTWTTPQAHDAAISDAHRWGRHGTKHGGRDLNDEAAMVSAWPTPTANCVTGAGTSGREGGMNIQTAVAAATWPTPTANQFEGGCPVKLLERREAMKAKCNNGNGFGLTLSQTAATIGLMLNGAQEPTEKRGALNPAFVCWLMGLPTEWDACGVMVTRSSRRSRQKS